MATDKGLEDVPEGKNSFPRLSLRLNRHDIVDLVGLYDPAPEGGRSTPCAHRLFCGRAGAWIRALHPPPRLPGQYG